MIYWDTSALLKVYNTGESSHARAKNLKETKERHSSSVLIRAELVGAVCGRLVHEPHRMRAVVSEAIEDLKGWTLFSVDPQIEPAVRLSQKHGLRGADAIHLATALTLRKEVTRKVRFVSTDRSQLAAARAEGFRVIDLSGA